MEKINIHHNDPLQGIPCPIKEKNNFQRSLVEFLFRHRVILMGDFITKSKRRTPYFFNFGQINSGSGLRELGDFYARWIVSLVELGEIPPPTAIFGPAYKGIPLALATVSGLERGGWDISYVFDRKEEKDHGDKGVLVGKKLDPSDQVVLIDDVITSGISIAQSIEMIRKHYRSQVVGVVLGVDRQESIHSSLTTSAASTGSVTRLSASAHLSQEFSIPVKAMVGIDEVLEIGYQNRLIDSEDYHRGLQHNKNQ